MKSDPLVSVIVPTKNSEKFLEACLDSIKKQAYNQIEIIVVDNHSRDNTVQIAKNYTSHVFIQGPERSAQRNYGAKKAKGTYLLFVDSDMELTDLVVKECIDLYRNSKNAERIGGIIIPEVSFGVGFWASCRALERSFYSGIDWIESERFFAKHAFDVLKGFDETMISGEDWDINQRLRASFEVKRVKNPILHNEGNPSLTDLVKKKTFYARQIKKYSSKQINKESFSTQANLFNRYVLYFSKPRKLFANPSIAVGMLFMKTCEFAGGVYGYLSENEKR